MTQTRATQHARCFVGISYFCPNKINNFYVNVESTMRNSDFSKSSILKNLIGLEYVDTPSNICHFKIDVWIPFFLLRSS